MDGFGSMVVAEVLRLPWTAIVGLIVAGVVSGLLLIGIVVGFVSDVHRFTQQRTSRREHPPLVVRHDAVRERLVGRGAA